MSARGFLLTGCFLIGLNSTISLAQLPATRLDGMFPPAVTIGQPTDVTITGGDLDGLNELVFSNPGITAKQKMSEPTPFDDGPQPIENQFTVTVADNVPPGNYTLRGKGLYGLSGPRTIQVDRTPAVNEVEPNKTIAEATQVPLATGNAPAWVNAQFNGGADVDWFKFHGQAGQRLSIAALSAELDSPSTVVIALITADGRALAESRRVGTRDAMINVQLPSEGDYFLKAYDLMYAGGADQVYRLRFSQQPSIEFIFPPAALPGSNDKFTIYGRNLPNGQPSSLTRNGKPLEQVEVNIPVPGDVGDKLLFTDRLEPYQAGLDGMEYRVQSDAGTSNAALISVATAPVVLEQPENNQPATAQRLKLPTEIAGQFYPQRDVDWFSFEAKANEEYWIELYSHRLGLATDASLLVQRVEKSENGEEKLTRINFIDDVGKRDGGFEFDQRTRDPVVQFKAPADGEYRVMVRDGLSSVISDPSLVYRLAIRPARPDFRIALTPVDSSGDLFLRKGGREAVNVVIFRQDGFTGEVRLSAENLPAGVTAPEVVAGPDCTQALLVFNAAADAPPSTGEVAVVGKAKVGAADVVHRARIGHPLANVPFSQPNNVGQASLPARLTDKLMLAVSKGEAEPVALTLHDPGQIETSRGGVVKVKYNVARDDSVGGNITAFAFGLPTVMNTPQTNIGAKEGEFELRFPANMTPGIYTTNLAAMIQGMNYSRNPEAAEAAKQRQERINKIFTESQQKTQTSQQSAQTAQNNLNQTNAQLAQAGTAKNQADQVVRNADNTLQAAKKKMEMDQQKMAEKPEDAALKEQFAASQKAVTDATENHKKAAEALTLAMTKVDELTKAKTDAEKAKQDADQALQDARQFQQLSQQVKQQADQKAQQLQQQSARRGYNHIIFSSSVTIKVAEFPIELNFPATQSVKQQEKLDVALQIQRKYEFNQPVNFQLIVPNGVNGLQIQNAAIQGDKNDGMITLNAQPNATPGEHKLTLRATMNFNGQNLILERPITLTVIENEAKK